MKYAYVNPKNLAEAAKISMDVEERIRDSSVCMQHVQWFYDKQFLVRNSRNDCELQPNGAVQHVPIELDAANVQGKNANTNNTRKQHDMLQSSVLHVGSYASFLIKAGTSYSQPSGKCLLIRAELHNAL